MAWMWPRLDVCSRPGCGWTATNGTRQPPVRRRPSWATGGASGGTSPWETLTLHILRPPLAHCKSPLGRWAYALDPARALHDGPGRSGRSSVSPFRHGCLPFVRSIRSWGRRRYPSSCGLPVMFVPLFIHSSPPQCSARVSYVSTRRGRWVSSISNFPLPGVTVGPSFRHILGGTDIHG